MGSPFTITSVSNYNSNPPSDDGSQTAANRVQWSTQKTKLADPVYNAFNSSETETSTAFGKVVGGAGFTSRAVSYTVTSSDQGKCVKATASAITITTPDATVVGSPFVFMVLNNSSGDITLAGNGTQTIDGNATIDVPVGCGCMLNTDGSNWFSAGLNFNNVLTAPQGYLTLTSGAPVITGDVTAATSVYYTPDVGDRIPISTDGSTFKMRGFTELTLTLVSNHLANTLYDVFVFDNSGTTTIGTGPAWNTNTAGSCARGTGAGTTELQVVHGLHTNKNSMTARNGSTTYTVAAGEGTYVGSIYVDGTAGEITCHRSYGQSRKWGVWNTYNSKPVYLKAGDSTSSWTVGSTLRPANNNSANSLTIFSGLAEDICDITAFLHGNGNQTATGSLNLQTAVGFNSTSVASGSQSNFQVLLASSNFTVELSPNAHYLAAPSLGINVVTLLEQGNGISVGGTEAKNLLTAVWRA